MMNTGSLPRIPSISLSGGSCRGEDRAEVGSHRLVLLKAVSQVVAGDHVMILGALLESTLGENDKPALLRHDRVYQRWHPYGPLRPEVKSASIDS
jgi:flavin reductase (DIM6/NTAB) family NADH-FMN oxidoreductase RutF